VRGVGRDRVDPLEQTASVRAAPPKRNRKGQAGIALIIVLWSTALLALIAGSFSQSSRSQIRLVDNAASMAQATALADAGFYRAVYALLTTPHDSTRSHRRLDGSGAAAIVLPSDGPLHTDGTVYEWRLHGSTVLMAIEAESAKIDVNRVSPEIIADLLQDHGIEPSQANLLAEGIAQRRRVVKSSWRPAELSNGESLVLPFNSLEELKELPGSGGDTWEVARQLLSVYGGSVSTSVISSRRAAGPSEDISGALVSSSTSISRLRAPTSGAANTFTVRVLARDARGSAFVREAVVGLGPEGSYRVFSWERGAAQNFATGVSLER
jgi:type II secretory pathway component PulK